MCSKRTDIDELYALIDETCMDKKYYVRRNANFVNHLAHAQIALFHLGSSMDYIRSYTENFGKKLEPKGGPLQATEDARIPTFDSVDDLLGKQSHFYDILAHYKNIFKTKYENNLEAFIVGEYTKLRAGIGDAAIHPIIHIGYGYSVKSTEVVIEGMAFLHYTHHALKLESYNADKLGLGNKSILEVAELLRADTKIYETMVEELKKTPEKMGFLSRMIYLLDYAGDDILKFIHMIECPRNPKDLMRFIIDSCITIYQMAENRNDFFLLHGITSVWALSNILDLFDEKAALEICQIFLCVVFSAYIGKDKADLNPKYLEVNGGQPLESWDEFIEKVRQLPVTTEEHRIKLIQVCYDSYQKNPEKSALYMKACQTTLDYHFHIMSKSASKRFDEDK